tara:strand:+ start:8634 stop:8741 length:108 start_codon:yes stop_codon:yes gene_type:complete
MGIVGKRLSLTFCRRYEKQIDSKTVNERMNGYEKE